MFNKEKLEEALNKYKKDFPKRWPGENYKWEALKCFHDNWEIDAEDFSAMIYKATEKTENLLAAQSYFPRKMIRDYAKQEPEIVREMFIELFDENKDEVERIVRFQSKAQDLCNRLTPGLNHYQIPRAITVYLWLMYPEKHSVFKLSVAKGAAKFLGSELIFKKGYLKENIDNNEQLIGEICEVVQNDDELKSIVDSVCIDKYYKEKTYRTTAFDVAFYITYYLLNSESKFEWSDTEFESGITKEKWMELLNDKEVFNKQGLEIVCRMYDFGGQATCTELSNKYGESVNFYNAGSTALAKRIAEKTGCDVMTWPNGKTYYPAIMYVGRYAKTEEGIFVWKLREELSEAIKERGTDDIQIYAKINDGEEFEKYSKEDYLSEVYMEENEYDILKSLLLNKQNLILQGAPGVGKTFAAKRLAYSILGYKDDNRIEFIQFHQNYSYEDFIMGYKPNGEGFSLQNGIFYKFCQKAANNPNEPFFFIIDEINRGNMSKIFGELLMLIEKEYRGTKMTLAYNGMPFSVPSNLYIIGMMNTADRSLAMIDYALRRRFSFYSMEPGFESDGFVKYMKSLCNDNLIELIERVKSLNVEIMKDASLGKGFCIGHSYFCGQIDCTDEWLHSVVDYDILPMLDEYWFDDSGKVSKWRNILLGVFED